jgi:hypothetical protein
VRGEELHAASVVAASVAAANVACAVICLRRISVLRSW